MSRTSGASLSLAVLLAPSLALAGRPDTGDGLWNYDETDVLDSVDGPAGVVRVHFSVDGPNVTLLDDDDGSGHPDFPEDVAATAEDVLGVFAATGFLEPVAESDLGLGPLGGSDAFDFYLLDFGGSADGQFAVDACEGGRCAGHMIIENDFRGYGYGSLAEAIRVLSSHELFHAVQAAYTDEMPTWMAEGTAVWAERLYDDEVEDFYYFASAYLDDVGRSIDRPPVGPVPAFAYGTCLFWEFLTERLEPAFLVSLLARSSEVEGLDAVEAALGDHGATLHEEWIAFTEANLATGRRAGRASFYPFAEEIDGIAAEDRGPSLRDDHRFYPLAATYYLLEHEGGDVWFATADDPAGLVLSLHEIDGEGERAEVGQMVMTWWSAIPTAMAVAPGLAAGDYWLRVTYPERAPQSRKIDFCVGTQDDVEECAPPVPDAGVDSGVPLDAGVDSGGPIDAGPQPADSGPGSGGLSGGATACSAASHSGDRGSGLPLWWLVGGLLILRRARRGNTVPVDAGGRSE